jgi:hypothetical protein
MAQAPITDADIARYHIIPVPETNAQRTVSTSCQRHGEIGALPAPCVRPIEGEQDASACRQAAGWQVGDMDAQTRVTSWSVVRAGPVIDAPMHVGWRQDLKA